MEHALSDEQSKPDFWAINYLTLPEALRDEGRRATALNFVTSAEAGLIKDWETLFERVLAKLRGDSVNNVSPLTQNKPTLSIVSPDDHTG